MLPKAQERGREEAISGFKVLKMVSFCACKALLWLVFVGLGIAAIVLVSLSLRGESRIDSGFAGTFCSAANLVQELKTNAV